VAEAHVPFYAIGGLELSNLGPVVAAGSFGVAVVRAVMEAADPGAASRALLETLHG
jgi:thiamine-phosphate pyrophosphorylase